MGVSHGSEAGDSDGDAMAGNGFGLRATKASDAQAAGCAHEGGTYDAISDGSFCAECVGRSTASAAANTSSSYEGFSS